MRPAFVLFDSAHLAALAITLIAPLGLAAMTRHRPHAGIVIRALLATILGGSWLAWFALFAMRGWLTLSNALPLNLCDWAQIALIVALLTRNPFAYVVGYFWGLGGTVQGLATPGIAWDFPDPQFLFFFLNHSGIVIALLYLTLADGLRPWPRQLPRVAAATLLYVAVAGAADFALGTNYAFLRAKPANLSLLDVLSPWPWYIPELVAISLLSLALYYAPFAILDAVRAKPTQGRLSPSRTTSDSVPLG